MTDDISISVEHVSKKYCKSLKRSMFYGVKDIAKNTLGMSSQPDTLRKSEFWAVDDVSFELKRGETLGIIGPNGSGKTTLLKMLNGIFWPDKGKIAIEGRVGALIAVGAGFHPLLNGRENIYINAAVMGMTKKEVDKKFDEIVAFADIGDFLDTPVKFYSSGMFVRLGFAVAAHCNPDILLIDEVLAVGDYGFQNKCIAWLNNFRNSGKIIIIVSHNLWHIEKIANQALLLNFGKAISYGLPKDVVSDYFKSGVAENSVPLENVSDSVSGKKIEITDVKLVDGDGSKRNFFESGETATIQLLIKSHCDINYLEVTLCIYREDGVQIHGTNNSRHNVNFSFKKGEESLIELRYQQLRLLRGTYYVNIGLTKDSLSPHRYDEILRALNFSISSNLEHGVGTIMIPHEWIKLEKN